MTIESVSGSVLPPQGDVISGFSSRDSTFCALQRWKSSVRHFLARFCGPLMLFLQGREGSFIGGTSRVSQAIAGKNVTVAVIRASVDPSDVEVAYKRATYADAANADILRQFETFALEYDKFGRGDLLSRAQCSVCMADHPCETCTLYAKYSDELRVMPPSIGGKRPTLDDVSNYILIPKYSSIKLPALPTKLRPSKWKERKDRIFRAVNPRNWLNMALLETERDRALKLKPIELYEDVEKDLGKNKWEGCDGDEKMRIQDRRLRLRARKLRGKGVFVTNKLQGLPSLDTSVKKDEEGMPLGKLRSAYPRTVLAKNESALQSILSDINQQSAVMADVNTVVDENERSRLEDRFFK